MSGNHIVGKAEDGLLVAHIARFLVPIYLADQSTIALKGTGTLLDGGDRLYLVTAAHVLDDCVPSTLSSAGGPTLAPLVSWREVRVSRPRDASKPPDTAVVEFLSPETIAALRGAYLPLTFDRVARATPGSSSRFILAGFPVERAKLDGKVLDHKPYVYFTTMLAEQPRGVKNPNATFDLFFSLGRAAWRSDGEREDVPRLQGASGCTIWEIGAGGKFWTPESALRAVGVQSSEMHGAWFRATNWLGGLYVLSKVDEPAAYALAVRLIGENQANTVFRGWGYDV